MGDTPKKLGLQGDSNEIQPAISWGYHGEKMEFDDPWDILLYNDIQ
jgi:hypothetical protein